MGRDYTPRQLHAADVVYGFSKNRTVIQNPRTGEEKVLYDPDSEETKKYPNLSFLFGNWLRNILKEYGADSHSALEGVEKRLDEIVRTDRGENDDPLYLWYIGKLDPCFHYHEDNSELLREYIVCLIREDIRKKEATA